MRLNDLMREQGKLLFRWRSFLPLALLPLFVAAISATGLLERSFGELAEHGFALASLGIALSGLALRAATVGCAPARTSGRNTRKQVADSLNTTGFYSVTRNPLYLGNFLIILGIALAIEVWWLVLIVMGAFALYYERIICAEEAFLEQKFGPAYTAWASRTPAFLPDMRLWRPAELPFSFRSVLRREYNGFYLIVVAFVTTEIGDDVLTEGQGMTAWIRAEGAVWLAVLAAATLLVSVLRTFKKRTNALRPAGR